MSAFPAGLRQAPPCRKTPTALMPSYAAPASAPVPGLGRYGRSTGPGWLTLAPTPADPGCSSCVPASPQAAASLCDDVRVTDEVLADQIDYYRRRAGEYDATAYGDVAAARARIAGLVAQMRPAGSVLEIACGTGLWTEALAGSADTVTAIDAAPEAVAIARDRVRTANVSFEVADVFSWDPGTRFGRFWQLLENLLAANGRVLFIDEHVDERGQESHVGGRDEVIERRLRDGSTFRVINNFVDPQELESRLPQLGWDCAIRRDGSDWASREARLAR